MKDLEQLQIELRTTCDTFKGLTDEMYSIFINKQAMYGLSNISLAGDMSKYEDRKMALLGLWFRMHDKIQRINNILKKDFKDDEIKFESLEDSYMDLANYAIISILVKKEVWGK